MPCTPPPPLQVYYEGERLVLPGPGLATFDDSMFVMAFAHEEEEGDYRALGAAEAGRGESERVTTAKAAADTSEDPHEGSVSGGKYLLGL